MADVFDLEGNAVPVPDEQVTELYLQGQIRLPQSDRYNLRDSNGELYSVSAEELNQEIAAGAQIATSGEVEEHFLEQEYGDREVSAAALGAARGLTLGLSDVAARDLGYQEAVREIEERNPVSSTVGEIVGAVAPALVTGGSSAVARGAVGAARMLPGAALTRAGTAIESAVARRLGVEAAETLGQRAIGRAAATGAAGTVEGAVQGAGQVVSEDALGRAELTAERLVAGVGLGAVLGLGVGGAVGGGGALAGDAVRRVGRRIADRAAAISETFAGEHGRALSDRVSRLYARVSSVATGADKGAIQRALSADERTLSRMVSNPDDTIDAAIRTGSEALDELDEAARFVQREAQGAAKDARMGALVDVDPLHAASRADEVLTRTVALAEEAASDTAAFGHKAAFRRVLDDAERARSLIREAAERGDAGAVFNELDAFKQRLGPYADSGGRMINDEAAAEGLARLRNMYHEVRDHLESADVYGEAATKAQREVNAATSRMLASSREYGQLFTRSIGKDVGGVDPFARRFMHDPSALGSFVKRLGDAENALPERFMGERITGQIDTIEAIARNYDLSPAGQAALERARAAAKRARTWIDDTTRDVGDINDFRRLEQKSSQARAVFGAVGTVGGAAVGAALAEDNAMGGAVGGGIGLLASLALAPDRAIRTVAALRRISSDTDNRMLQGVRGFLGKGAEATREGARRAGVGVRRAAPIVARQEYADRISALSEIVRPEVQQERLSERTAGIAQHAPKAAAMVAMTASRGAAFLQSKVPPSARRTDPLFANQKRDIPPSDAEMTAFLRYARAVDDPLSVLDDMREGKLTRQAVEALREVYPQLHQQVVRTVMTELSEDGVEVGYTERIQLGILLGVPTHPSLEPRFIATMQGLYQGLYQQGPEAAQHQPSLAPSKREPPRTSGSLMTDVQRLQAKGAAA